MASRIMSNSMMMIAMCIMLMAMTTTTAATTAPSFLFPFAFNTSAHPIQGSASWKNCGSDNDHAKDLKITFTQNPVPGEPYSYTTSYELDETVTGGKVTTKFFLNGIPISTTTGDLCETLKGGETPCPLEQGKITSHNTGEVPKGLFGTYGGQTSWTDQNGDPILCIDITLKL